MFAAGDGHRARIGKRDIEESTAQVDRPRERK